jgi:signal transduction histidine kinase
MSLEEKGLSENVRDFITTAKFSGDILLALVNNLLDISKANAAKMTLESLDLNIEEIVERSVKCLHGYARSTEVEWLWYVSNDVPVNLLGDPVRLQQILFNLMSNAAKYTHSGFIKISCVCLGISCGRAELEFSVQDTGEGRPLAVVVSRCSFTSMFRNPGSSAGRYLCPFCPGSDRSFG